MVNAEPVRTETLVDILAPLEELTHGVYAAPPRFFAARRKFGGEVMGQAVLAGGASLASARRLHALSALFTRPANSAQPTEYRVTQLRDGHNFSARTVSVWQDGRQCAEILLSFSDDVPTREFEHSDDAADGQVPDEIPGAEEQFAKDQKGLAWYRDLSARGDVDIRFPNGPGRSVVSEGRRTPPDHTLWLRSRTPLGASPLIHDAAIAYLSDYMMLALAGTHHGVTAQDPRIQFATVTHTISFHSPTRADAWIRHDNHTPWAGSGRAMTTGQMFNATGQLVASTAQEGVLRLK